MGSVFYPKSGSSPFEKQSRVFGFESFKMLVSKSDYNSQVRIRIPCRRVFIAEGCSFLLRFYFVYIFIYSEMPFYNNGNRNWYVNLYMELIRSFRRNLKWRQRFKMYNTKTLKNVSVDNFRRLDLAKKWHTTEKFLLAAVL